MAPIFRDPFEILPPEIVMVILQYFDFKQAVAILRVSKQWERFLSSLRKLWTHLDFSGALFMPVSLPAIRACINRSKAILTHATFVNISSPAVDKGLLYLSLCPNLEYLDIRVPCEEKRVYELFKTSKNLRALISSKDLLFSQSLLTRLLADLPALERIECHTITPPRSQMRERIRPAKMPNLKVMALSSAKKEDLIDGSLVHLWDDGTFSNSIPNLEELRIRRIPSRSSRSFLPFTPSAAGLPNLRRLDLSGMVLPTSIIDLPPNLEYLRFHKCFPFPVNDFFDEVNLKLPNLHSIILEDTPWFTYYARIILDASEGALRYLHISNIRNLEMLIGTTAFKGLRELRLAYIDGLTDSHVFSLLNNMPELKVLHIPYTDTTGCTIKAIAEARGIELIEEGSRSV
jgi:F-box/TPR repeat protein Pof3